MLRAHSNIDHTHTRKGKTQDEEKEKRWGRKVETKNFVQLKHRRVRESFLQSFKFASKPGRRRDSFCLSSLTNFCPIFRFSDSAAVVLSPDVLPVRTRFCKKNCADPLILFCRYPVDETLPSLRGGVICLIERIYTQLCACWYQV